MSTRGVLSDVRDFMLHRPAVSTLVSYATRDEREDYSQRIAQRLDIDVERYAILNIHRIGIAAPVAFIFEQLRTWQPKSVWWPNRIARLEATSRELDHIRVYLLGRKKPFLGLKKPTFFGLNVIPLFEMTALRILEVPETLDQDNARYLLYRCSGGYPVGIVGVYVRSPIKDQNEEPNLSQLFFAVGFNFYGRDDWPEHHPINSIWERIHNRVTANVLNRLKVECEARFAEVVAGSFRPGSVRTAEDPQRGGKAHPRVS